MIGMASLVAAAEVTLVKHDPDKKLVTVKEGDKESVYKYTDKTKVTLVDRQDGSVKEGTLAVATKLFSKDTAVGKLKFEIATDKDTITEIKLKVRKK